MGTYLGDFCNGRSCEVNGCCFENDESRKGLIIGHSVVSYEPAGCFLKVAGIMDQFERQFEHLDVQTQTMEEAMSGVTTLTIPEVSKLYLSQDLHWKCSCCMSAKKFWN